MTEKYPGLSDKNSVKVEQLEALITPTLEYVQVGIPEFTSHGRIHSLNLVDIIQDTSNKITFSEAEIFILYCSAWLHDIGCIRGKKEIHNECSIEIIEENTIFETIVTTKALPLIKIVILSHSSNYKNFDRIPEFVTLFYENDTRIRLISAIFRLIDGCDITSSRTDILLYNIKKDYMPSGNKEYWDAHREIQNIVFSVENKSIVVYTEGEVNGNILIEHLKTEFRTVSNILSEYNFPLHKIEIKSIPKREWEEYI